MMELIKEWIMGITCVSVVLAAAQSLMPEGTVRKIGNLAGGLLLLLALAAPFAKLNLEDLSIALTEYRMAEAADTALLELENKRLVKAIIAEQTAAYISNRAAELGISCSADVSYKYSEEGNAYPVSVTIYGALTAVQQGELSRIIERDLAIEKENQTYETGDAQ